MKPHALMVQKTSARMPIPLATFCAKLMKLSSTTQVTGGRPGVLFSLARRSPNGAAALRDRESQSAGMVPENVEHTPLISSSDVSEAKGHRDVAVHAERSDKRSRELVGLFHLDLVVTGIRIKKG